MPIAHFGYYITVLRRFEHDHVNHRALQAPFFAFTSYCSAVLP